VGFRYKPATIFSSYPAFRRARRRPPAFRAEIDRLINGTFPIGERETCHAALRPGPIVLDMSISDPNTVPRGPEQQSPGRFAGLFGSIRKLGGWGAGNRLRAAGIIGGCLISVTGVVVVWVLIAGDPSSNGEATLAAAFRALEQGDLDRAREMALALKSSKSLPVAARGGPVFVLGVVAARDADDAFSRERKDFHLLAARYLEEARDRGFPPGRRAEGLFLLGRSLYESGQMAACRPPLKESLEADGRRATDIHRLLAAAYLNDGRPEYAKALEHNSAYLADKRLSAEERNAGLVQRASILLCLDRPAESLAALEAVPADAANRAESTLLRGRLLMHEARAISKQAEANDDAKREAAALLRKAIDTFRRAQGQETLAADVTGRAMYLIGVCYRELGDYAAARAQLIRAAEHHAEGPEQLAAVLEQAELSRNEGEHEDALAAYLRVLDEAGSADTYRNPWVPLAELRSRLLDACREYLKTESFTVLVPLVRRLEPLLGRARMLELRAEAHRQWAEKCSKLAESADPDEAEPLRRKARAELRAAGWALLELSKEEVASREYTDHLWFSADAYLHGQDYTQALRVLKKYLREETQRRRAEGLARLGRALLAVGRLDEAAAALSECIDLHPRDPATYQARLLVARTCIEQGKTEKAAELLEENLRGERLTPDSREWRDSLFMLGKVLRSESRYDEAIRRMEEAVTRYGEDARAVETRYLIADAYCRSAEALRKRLRQPRVGAGPGALSREVEDRYQRALAGYAEVRRLLGRRQETEKLSAHEAALLRNAYFAAGSVLLALGQYEAAVEQYTAAMNRYQNSPAVLEAYVQAARAHRRLDRPVEARATLEQAKVVLRRFEPTADFASVTNYTSEQWAERLDWLSNL